MKLTENKGTWKTQKEHIEHFNEEGIKMISASDVYKIFKTNDTEALNLLKTSFKDYLVTSTRIIYDKKTLNATIIQDCDSTVVKEKSTKVKVPDYSGDFKEDKDTEKYLQTLFDTKDSLKVILSTLKSSSGRGVIRLWSPDQSGRDGKQERAVRLFYDYFDRFSVDGGDSDFGLSRGVLSDSAKPSKYKEIKCKHCEGKGTIKIKSKNPAS